MIWSAFELATATELVLSGIVPVPLPVDVAVQDVTAGAKKPARLHPLKLVSVITPAVKNELESVLFSILSSPVSVARVPVVGKVTFVEPVVTNVRSSSGKVVVVGFVKARIAATPPVK